jgi:hypothetical protein
MILGKERESLPRLSRGEFGKLGFLGAVGAALGAKELSVARRGHFVHNGVAYCPMYERHAFGPHRELPANTGAFFMECNTFVLDKDDSVLFHHYDLSIDDLNLMLKNQDPRTLKILEKARRQGIPVALGDVLIPEDLVIDNGDRIIDTNKFYYGLLATVVSQFPGIARRRESRSGEEITQEAMSRRHFLTAACLGCSWMGASLGLWRATETNYFSKLMLGRPDEDTKFHRPLLRFLGITSHLHPDKPVIFTRNLIFALKMKMLGEWTEKNGFFPLVSYNEGGHHSGCEDFISLPSDLVRVMIAYINRKWLGDHLDFYGIDHFCSLRIIRSENGGDFQDYEMLTDHKLKAMIQKSI